MNQFETMCDACITKMGDARIMVLSTSLDNKVSSRNMSIVIHGGKFYFQTDCTLRKYEQLSKNQQVALCCENIQIEGICEELGCPLDNQAFCEVFEKNYKGSYKSYTPLKNERLFAITPTFIQLWIYENGEAYVETYDFIKKEYRKQKYLGV